MAKTFKTPKGTELTLASLKGKDYLLAADRILWFREENPSGILKSTMIEHNGEGMDEYCIFVAEVYVNTDRGPMMIAQAHKRESRRDFSDFIEKCQTSAYARALSLAGYGTQFTGGEMDEGDRLADAPVKDIAKLVISNDVITPAVESGAVVIEPKVAGRSSFRRSNTTTKTASAGDDI